MGDSLTWPFPRNAYARIISFLTASKAKGVAFDCLLPESSAQAVENDAELADSTAGSLPVVSAVALESYEKYVSPEKWSS